MLTICGKSLVGGVEVGLQIEECERPPKLDVKFSLRDGRGTEVGGEGGTTLFNALQTMRGEGRSLGGGTTKGHLNRTCEMSYEVAWGEMIRSSNVVSSCTKV